MQLAAFSISKEEIGTLDDNTTNLYFQAYRTCKQIEEHASSGYRQSAFLPCSLTINYVRIVEQFVGRAARAKAVEEL